MSKVKLLTVLGKVLKVEGRIFLNSHEVGGDKYDEVLLKVVDSDEQAVHAKEFVDKKVLLVTPRAIDDAKILQELGY